MLQSIPDDKVVHVLEIMRGLMRLYNTDNDSMIIKDRESSVMGILKKYANPKLIPMEKEAWGEAVREKYANN